MSNGWNFSGIQALDARDPGPVASGTVPSGEIAPWLMEHVPELFQLRGDAQTPWEQPNAPLVDQDLGITPPWLNAPFPRPGFDPAAAEAEAISKKGARGMGSIPGTYGLLSQDPVDWFTTGAGAIKGGIMGAKSVGEGFLRTLGRYRPGSPSNIDEVADVLQQVAPAGMRPPEATAAGLSDVVRTKLGIGTVRSAREAVDAGIRSELNAITATNQLAATQGMIPGSPYALQAASRVPDLAMQFKGLTDELAMAGRGMANPQTGQMRPTVGGLAAARSREEIYQDIQAMLSPEQWQRFLASQTEYAQASTLARLFSAGKKGVAPTVDVLTDPQKLQQKAKTMQDALNDISPEILKVIFRGGRPVTTDMPAGVPVGFGAPGKRLSLRIPGTVMAGPVGPVGNVLGTLAGAGMGAVGPKVAMNYGVPLGASVASWLNQYNPFMDSGGAGR